MYGDHSREGQVNDNTSGINTEIKINGQKLDTVTSFKYLGSALEMRCYRKILHISYKDHVTNEEVSAKIQQLDHKKTS